MGLLKMLLAILMALLLSPSLALPMPAGTSVSVPVISSLLESLYRRVAPSSALDLAAVNPVGYPNGSAPANAPVATNLIKPRNASIDVSTPIEIEKAFRLSSVQPSESVVAVPQASSDSSSSSVAPSPQYVVPAAAAEPAPPASGPAGNNNDDDDSASDPAPASESGSDASSRCGSDEAAIIITNHADHDICYMVELSAQSNRVKEITVPCGPGNGFTVPARKGGREFCPGNNFVGALTAFHYPGGEAASSARVSARSPAAGAERGRGTRFEFTFEDGTTWYDVDYEMGIDSATLSPALDKDAKVGEKDVVAKVDRAYQELSAAEQAEVRASGYVDVDGEGKVKDVRMDKKAPDAVVSFLQLRAGLNGYVNPGSVDGEKGGRNARFGIEGVKTADRQTKKTGEKRLLITSF